MTAPANTRRHNVLIVCMVVAVAFAIAVIVLVTPDQKNTTTPAGSIAPIPNAGLVLPLVQLEGQWFSKDDGTMFVATVTGEDLEIQVSFSGETSALYWHGTFKTSESPGVTITSNKTERPEEIVLAQSPTKDFRIERDAITFKFSAMGFSKMVTLKR